MRLEIDLQLWRKVFPARSLFWLERGFDQLMLRPAFDDAACIPGARNRPSRFGVDRKRGRLLSVVHVGVEDGLINVGRSNAFEAAVTDQARKLGQAGTIL
jgi:hypothetical protein